MQKPLFLEGRTRYLIRHKVTIIEAWYMGGLFILDNYRIVNNVEVLERVGNEKEMFK